MKKSVLLISIAITVLLSACNNAETMLTGESSEVITVSSEKTTTEALSTEILEKESMIVKSSVENNEGENEMSELNKNIGKDNKTAIIYFSVTNNTKKVSENINNYFIKNDKPVDLIEINPKEPYTDNDINYSNSNSRSSREQNDDNARPEIKELNIDFNNYDTIFLGYPIWWGTYPKVILTFLEKYDLTGRVIIPFCTSASSGIGSSDKDLQKYTKAFVKSGKRFSSSASKEEVYNWIKSIFNDNNMFVDNENNRNDVPAIMKMYINNKLIPVIWENNKTTKELISDIEKNDISVDLSMYSNNEQVGSLNKTYTSEDEEITTNCGDIVLYNNSNIVLFYGSNKWAYTKLGKIDLPDEDIVKLLGNGNVTLNLSKK